MKLEFKAIISRSEEERIQKLGAAFRETLSSYFTAIVLGVRYSPGVMRELTMALLEHAAAALIASSDAAQSEADEDTAERCKRAAREALQVLEREVLS